MNARFKTVSFIHFKSVIKATTRKLTPFSYLDKCLILTISFFKYTAWVRKLEIAQMKVTLWITNAFKKKFMFSWKYVDRPLNISQDDILEEKSHLRKLNLQN